MDKAEKLQRMRHSAAHTMAEAVLALFPEAKLAIGPAIDTGFYYDFDLPRPLTPEDLPAIEDLMRKSVAQDHPFQQQEVGKEEARRILADQPYKLEIIDGIADSVVSLYRHGPFLDLCEGPHVESTGRVGAFRLTHVAGAYWRGDETRPMLQRIYGALFDTEEELQEHLHRLEEAQRRDHRRLGRELDLFSTHEEFGPGLVFWHPKGARLRGAIEDYLRREHHRRGYEPVYTPHVGKAQLWQVSGHLDFYREYMYPPMDMEGQTYFVKPMNCPFHILIYKSHTRSYRELPLRLAELGTVYRYERSGVVHGLLRVRGFTQDDAHIFCRPDQLEEEIAGVVEFSLEVLGAFGFSEFEAFLSTRPEKFVGEVEAWETATEALRRALSSRGLAYQVDEGGGAFYGPKIDLKVQDSLGRSWQLSTIQVDFNLPQRFDMAFAAADGHLQRPLMIHRAILGSFERFLGILIEQYEGAFPAWLAPVQARCIPIADRHLPYAEEVAARLRARRLRVDVDGGHDRMQAKIRRAQLEKIPYALVVGDREAAEGTLAVRKRGGEDLGAVPLDQFEADLLEEVQTRRR